MSRVVVLRRHELGLAAALLPPVPDPPAELGEDDRFKIHAYLVLACALVEEHIEVRFKEYVDDRASSSEEGRVHGCFVSLAAKFAKDLIGQNSGKVPSGVIAVPTLIGLYGSKVVRANNGVKRSNVESLAKPLGLGQKLDLCEEVFIPLEVLGSKRGAVAHLGVVEEEIGPAEARQIVSNVMDNLHVLERLFDESAGSSGH